MKMYYVYKENHCEYSENKGHLIISTSPERAKGIAMADTYWRNVNNSKVFVKEIDVVEEGVLCRVDSVDNSTRAN